MIRVTVELISSNGPQGNRLLGRFLVHRNPQTRLQMRDDTCDYTVIGDISKKPSSETLTRVTGIVKSHQYEDGVWPLLVKALRHIVRHG